MDPQKQKRGPRPKGPAVKKLTKSLTLSPAEIEKLELLAHNAGMTPSQLIVRKLNLSSR